MKHILLNNLRSKHIQVMELPEYTGNDTYSGNDITKKKIYQKISWKLWLGNQFQALFNFQGIHCKNAPEEFSVLICTNFDRFL